MTDEKPWWRPIADALADRVAKAIKDYEPTEDDKVRVLDAAFDDIPPKGPRKRRKALPSHPPLSEEEQAEVDRRLGIK